MNLPGNGVWKSVAAGAGSALLVIAGSWLTLGRELATESYVQHYVATSAPWVRSEAVVIERVNRNEQILQDLIRRREVDADSLQRAIQENTKAIIRLQVIMESVMQDAPARASLE